MNKQVSNNLRRERGTAKLLAIGVTIAGVLAAGCGSTALRPGGSPTPSTSPSPTPSATPTATPAPSQFQVLVQDTVISPAVQTTVSLYSSTTGLAPIVLTFPADSGGAQFAPNDRISFTGGVSWLYTADLTGGARRQEVNLNPSNSTGASWIGAYGWSDDGALAYLAGASSGSGENSQLVIRPTNGPVATVALPAVVGVEPFPEQSTVRFSPDGTYTLLVDAFAGFTPDSAHGQSSVQVRRLDGTLAFAAPWDGEAATMPADAVWGTDGRLYFWDASGVNVVDLGTGVTRTLLPGVRWYNPSVSPDGRYIAFELRDAQGVPQLKLLDTTSATLMSDFEIPAASSAHFVSPTVLWFHQETPCSSSSCSHIGFVSGTTQTTQVLDPLLSYDLTTHTQAAVGLSGFVTDSRVLPAS